MLYLLHLSGNAQKCTNDRRNLNYASQDNAEVDTEVVSTVRPAGAAAKFLACSHPSVRSVSTLHALGLLSLSFGLSGD